MSFIVDARGLACPQPVVLTNKAFDEADEVITIVDNEVSRENVTRLAKSKGFKVEIEGGEGEFHLHLSRDTSAEEQISCQPLVSGLTVLLIGSDVVGRGSAELGRTLMNAFVQVLHDITPQPDMIIFLNSGVKLITEGSRVIEDFKALEEEGTELLACGTCLGYYELKDKVAVGKISNMFDIASAMFGAGKIITL